jgi:hypothetical protein
MRRNCSKTLISETNACKHDAFIGKSEIWKRGTEWAQLDTTTTDGRANLPVCPNLTASQRSNAGGTMGIRTPEHRSARSGGSLGGAAIIPGGAAAPPYPLH